MVLELQFSGFSKFSICTHAQLIMGKMGLNIIIVFVIFLDYGQHPSQIRAIPWLWSNWPRAVKQFAILVKTINICLMLLVAKETWCVLIDRMSYTATAVCAKAGGISRSCIGRRCVSFPVTGVWLGETQKVYYIYDIIIYVFDVVKYRRFSLIISGQTS